MKSFIFLMSGQTFLNVKSNYTNTNQLGNYSMKCTFEHKQNVCISMNQCRTFMYSGIYLI